MNILELEHIHKTYGDYKANNDISLTVPEQSIFGLLGPNGAGKSTLIRIITNIIASDSGTIRINGEPFNERHHEIIGYMPEERGLYKKMKVGEHLMYLARLKNMDKKAAKEGVDYWLNRFDIADWWDKKVEELSKGMQQKVQFIATVVNQPKLLILDEPFSGLDPVNSNLIKDEIFRMKEEGTSIIFSTHRMEQVEEICEEIALINKGRNILNGKVHDIKQQFKKHQFSVQFVGEFPGDFPGEKFNIIERNQGGFIVQTDAETSPNELLRALLNLNIEIHNFQEILPSINEIFITQVQNKA